MSEEEEEQILYLRRYLQLGCKDGDAQMCKDLEKNRELGQNFKY